MKWCLLPFTLKAKFSVWPKQILLLRKQKGVWAWQIEWLTHRANKSCNNSCTPRKLSNWIDSKMMYLIWIRTRQNSPEGWPCHKFYSAKISRIDWQLWQDSEQRMADLRNEVLTWSILLQNKPLIEKMYLPGLIRKTPSIILRLRRWIHPNQKVELLTCSIKLSVTSSVDSQISIELVQWINTTKMCKLIGLQNLNAHPWRKTTSFCKQPRWAQRNLS